MDLKGTYSLADVFGLVDQLTDEIHDAIELAVTTLDEPNRLRFAARLKTELEKRGYKVDDG